MGIYNYISSILFLVIAFADFGISTATSKYIAQYNRISKDKVNKVLFNSSLMIFIPSLLIIAFLLIFAKNIFPQNYMYLYYTLPFILVYPLTSLLDGIYRGLKRFKTLSIITVISGIVGILGSYIFVTTFGLIGALLNQVIFFGTYVILLFFLNGNIELKIDRKIVKDIGGYSIYFGVATLGYFLFSKANTLILGSYNLMEEIAVYELLNKVYAIYLIPFTVFGQVLAPNVVDMFSSKKYESVTKIFNKSLLYSLLSILLFVPISMIITRIGISILFPHYLNDTFYVLLLPVALTCAKAIPVSVINGGLITSTGHAKYMAIENVVVGILNVLLNIFVIRIYGYVGIVWVTLILQCISTSILYFVYYKRLQEYIE